MKQGDRVRVKDKGYTGTVKEVDGNLIVVSFDHPVRSRIKNTDEFMEIYVAHVLIGHLELIEGNDLDWEDMWGDGAT